MDCWFRNKILFCFGWWAVTFIYGALGRGGCVWQLCFSGSVLPASDPLMNVDVGSAHRNS